MSYVFLNIKVKIFFLHGMFDVIFTLNSSQVFDCSDMHLCVLKRMLRVDLL